MQTRFIAAAFLCALALAARPVPAVPTVPRSPAASSQTQGRTWCDANAGRPVFGAVLCEAVADEVRIYIRGLPFEVVAIGSDYLTVRPELSGERRRLLTIPYTAIRRLERTGRSRELILDL